MATKLFIAILFIFFFSCDVSAQHGSGYVDFQSSFSNSIYNDTDFFNGTGIFGASDITVQDAFQTIDASGVTLITVCEISDDFCFKFAFQQLTLYVNGTAQSRWPQSATGYPDALLLESGAFLLQEIGDEISLE